MRREGKEPREEEPHHGEKFCTKERRIRCYCSIASLNLQGWTTQNNITKYITITEQIQEREKVYNISSVYILYIRQISLD